MIAAADCHSSPAISDKRLLNSSGFIAFWYYDVAEAVKLQIICKLFPAHHDFFVLRQLLLHQKAPDLFN